jgi:hypothetical protein
MIHWYILSHQNETVCSEIDASAWSAVVVNLRFEVKKSTDSLTEGHAEDLLETTVA